MNDFLHGELRLTLDIIFGLLAGEIILRLGLADLILKKFSRLKIPSVTALAAAVSAGSSKTGAALIASALEKNQISPVPFVFEALGRNVHIVFEHGRDGRGFFRAVFIVSERGKIFLGVQKIKQ